MRIHFQPNDFLRLFKLAASAAAARDVKPILQNVKIVADKEVGTILMATDMTFFCIFDICQEIC